MKKIKNYSPEAFLYDTIVYGMEDIEDTVHRLVGDQYDGKKVIVVAMPTDMPADSRNMANALYEQETEFTMCIEPEATYFIYEDEELGTLCGEKEL